MPTAERPPDKGLLEALVAAQVTQNRARAARLEALSAFHSRRVAEQEDSTPSQGFFVLTPLQETKAEVAPLTGAGEQSIEHDLDTHARLTGWLPRLWERCRSGRLDLGRALVCLDQLTYLATDADREAYATAIQDWFDKQDPLHDTEHPLCTLTQQRVSRAARYQRLKLPQRSDAETFAEAFKKRRVGLRVDEETGMARLSGTMAVHDAITADHRLTLIAERRAQAQGETRTLAQLRVDSLLDLIHGRLVVPATTGDLEHHGPCASTCRVNGDRGDARPETRRCPLHPLVLTTDDGGPIGGYARPVVNVTVPLSTLMGVSDTPGVLSGGAPLPADYLRHLATRPGSTWHRMLTEDTGGFVALSTSSYQPTGPILRTVVARDHTCVWPGCRRPSVACECDHQTPWPEGPTCCHNLAPLCRRHHRVKHAAGYRVVRNTDGSYTWKTRHCSTFTTPACEQPVCQWPAPETARPAQEDHHRVDAELAALSSPVERAFARLITSGGQSSLP